MNTLTYNDYHEFTGDYVLNNISDLKLPTNIFEPNESASERIKAKLQTEFNSIKKTI